MVRTLRLPLAVLVLAVAALWLMGMGGGTENGATGNIPIPQENFTVTVTDRTGQKLEARRFTWEGKVFLRGQVGSATVSMPFDKIRTLRVAPSDNQTAGTLLKTSVTLRSGDTVDVMIDRGSKCYGDTKFGGYEIFFKDVASVEFQ